MKLNIFSSLSLVALYLPAALAQTDGNLVQPTALANGGGDLTISLDLAEGAHSTVAASTLNTRLLGGSLPGPTVRVRPGNWLFVNFSNDLDVQTGVRTGDNDWANPDQTNLHFHGAHVSGEAPGDDTTLDIGPGQSFNFEVFFPGFHQGGTHWIHPHRHTSGTSQVGGGASTALIVEDLPGDVPPEVANAEEVVMVVQLFDEDYLNSCAERGGDGVFELDSNVGNTFRLVNGQYRPTLDITAGQWQRWRVIFASWDRAPLDFELLTNGVCESYLLAKDGVYINDYPRPLTFYPISTAGRADIMVRCSAAGEWDVIDYGGTLLTLRSTVSGSIDSTPPTSNWSFRTPTYLTDLRNRRPTPGCECSTRLSGGNRVNGLVYSPGSFVHTVAQGSIVERTLQGLSSHPYHQHVYPFQITDISNTLSADDAEYHKIGDYHDTLMIRSAGDVTVMYEANNFLGRMAVHCHRLDHSDFGMLSAEDVVDPARGGVCDCNAVNYSRGPTNAPVQPQPDSDAPTDAPVASPTRAPSNPTAAPIESSAGPSEAPVDPTPAPVEPTEAPVEPTEAPVEPTEAPVEPTTAPVDPGPAPCEDSPLKAIIDRKARTCQWVVDNNRCDKKSVWSHCRKSCGFCKKCVDSGAKIKFRPTPEEKKIRKHCRWIKGNRPELCDINPDIPATCPKLCGVC